MAPTQASIENTFHAPGTPEELKAWWTDLPEVYEAEDPREQPHRIELVEETADGAVYDTTWRGPLGMTFTMTEELHDEGPGKWRFVVPNPGFRIEDRYTAEPADQGTRLTITSTLTITRWFGHLTRRLLIPGWEDQLSGTFQTAVEVYRDKRSGSSPR